MPFYLLMNGTACLMTIYTEETVLGDFYHSQRDLIERHICLQRQ